MKVEYSVLNYYPSFMSEECITVAIAFHNIVTNERYFEITRNYKRIETFDDEANIKFLKANLEGMSMEIKDPMFNYIENDFSLKEYCRKFVNEYKFEPVRSMENIYDVDQFIEETKKIYMKSDYKKEDRLNSKQKKRYIRNYLKSNELSYNSKPVCGKFNDEIRYDYILENLTGDKDYGIKIFVFEGKNTAHMLNSARAWAYNSLKLKDKINTVFVYDQAINDDNYKIIYNMLSEHSHRMLSIQETIEFLDSVNPNLSIQDELNKYD